MNQASPHGSDAHRLLGDREQVIYLLDQDRPLYESCLHILKEGLANCSDQNSKYPEFEQLGLAIIAKYEELVNGGEASHEEEQKDGGRNAEGDGVMIRPKQ